MIEGIRLRAQLRPVWEKVSSALGKIQDLAKNLDIQKKNKGLKKT